MFLKHKNKFYLIMTFQNMGFKYLCDKVRNPCKTLLLHIDVQWLPQGIVQSGCKLPSCFLHRTLFFTC